MRVLIADDEALFRDGTAALLGREGFEVVGQVADADEVLRVTPSLCPDVVITDIRMPPNRTDDGLRVALHLRSSVPPVNVLVVSQHVQPAYAMRLLEDGSGGIGYLLKQRIARVDEFCRAVREVGGGGTVLDPEVAAALQRRARRRDRTPGCLTPRQREVLGLVAAGRSNLAIARVLGVTEKAVVRHVSNIYDQLDIADTDDHHRRVLAAVTWLTAEPVA